MFKKILIIINPVAGADEPILSIIHRKLHPTNISWEIRVTQNQDDIKKYVTEAIRKKVNAIAVYGGDGTVTEATELLYKSSIPLIILPGGTANILAKELNIPLYAEQMLDLLVKKKIKIKKIDMGIMNKRPFLLRVSYGLLADMIVETDRDWKKTIGQFAYGISAIKKLGETKTVQYTIKIGKKQIITEGISLVVANGANMGMTGLSFLQEVDMADGKLDLFILKNNNLGYLTSLAAGALSGTKSDELDHWANKKIQISVSPGQRVLCDDTVMTVKKAIFEIVPHAVSLVIPKI